MSMTVLTMIMLGLQAAAPKPVLTSDLPKYDQKTVTVVGKIEKYEEKVAKASKKPYTVFTLADSKGKVNIYLRGRPENKLKDGDKVKVTGIYSKEKKIKESVFKNEIDATVDKEKSHGVKLVK